MSLQRISITILLILLATPLSKGNPYRLKNGAEEAGMGMVCLTRPGFSRSFHNQALMAYNSSLTFGVGYENRFNIKELGTTTAGIVVPLDETSIGAIYSHFGYADFSRSTTGIAAGMKLSERFAAGVQIDYLHERQYGEYNTFNAVTFEVGATIGINEKTTFGFHLFNPLPNSLRNSPLPSTVSMGLGSAITGTLYIAAEAQLDSDNKLIVKTGFEYEAVDNLMLRGGFYSANNSFTFGIGYLLEPGKIDFAFISHESLGMTSMISLQFIIR